MKKTQVLCVWGGDLMSLTPFLLEMADAQVHNFIDVLVLGTEKKKFRFDEAKPKFDQKKQTRKKRRGKMPPTNRTGHITRRTESPGVGRDASTGQPADEK
jgi:hypothetical protein